MVKLCCDYILLLNTPLTCLMLETLSLLLVERVFLLGAFISHVSPGLSQKRHRRLTPQDPELSLSGPTVRLLRRVG